MDSERDAQADSEVPDFPGPSHSRSTRPLRGGRGGRAVRRPRVTDVLTENMRGLTEIVRALADSFMDFWRSLSTREHREVGRPPTPERHLRAESLTGHDRRPGKQPARSRSRSNPRHLPHVETSRQMNRQSASRTMTDRDESVSTPVRTLDRQYARSDRPGPSEARKSVFA